MLRTRVAAHRQWLYLAFLAAAVFFLFPHLIGFPRALRVLGSAQPAFLALALGAESVRYLASAASTRVLGRLFGQIVPFEPLVEAFFAGAAANRTFSTAGAPGMVVRCFFLTGRGLSTGQVAAIYLIEDIAGLVIGGAVFLLGAHTLAAAPSTTTATLLIAFPAGSALLAVAAILLYRRRALVERVVHGVARAIDEMVRWLLGRPVYDPQSTQRAIDQFYAGMSIARRSPLLVCLSFLFNVSRYLAGIVAVYCSFLGLGWAISPGALVLIYTSASVLSTLSAVPGELAILGSSWAILSLSFGLPRETAAMALILSRTIAFWLPIPVGYLAFWNLRRQRYL